MHAIGSVPRLYVQVLHLMNKMNLPPPFDTEFKRPSYLSRDSVVADSHQRAAASSSFLTLSSESPFPPPATAPLSEITGKDSTIHSHKPISPTPIHLATHPPTLERRDIGVQWRRPSLSSGESELETEQSEEEGIEEHQPEGAAGLRREVGHGGKGVEKGSRQSRLKAFRPGTTHPWMMIAPAHKKLKTTHDRGERASANCAPFAAAPRSVKLSLDRMKTSCTASSLLDDSGVSKSLRGPLDQLGMQAIEAARFASAPPPCLDSNPSVKSESSSVHTTASLSVVQSPTEVPPVHSFLTEAELAKGRMSYSELMDKFPLYTPGTPSPSLYVKNLARRTTEVDLWRVFGVFLGEEIRTMGPSSPVASFTPGSNVSGPSPLHALSSKRVPHGHTPAALSHPALQLHTQGRLRQQAFIHFTTTEIAHAALRATHGYVLHSRPLLVSFARK